MNPCLRSIALSALLLPAGFLHAQKAQPPALLPTPADYARAAAVVKNKPAKRTVITGDIRRSINDALITPPRDTPLPSTAIDALVLQNEWMTSENKPSLGKHGQILYTFGQGLPVIVTSPLNITSIDLQPGEHVVPDGIDIGDDRFQPVPHQSGDHTYIVLKPKESGLDTTMIVGTNVRSYYLRLVSKPYDHLSRVAFTYPDDEAARVNREYQSRIAAEEQKETEEARLKAADTTGPIRSTDYSMKVGKHAEYMRPVKVYDDGAHTYIELSENVRHRDFPILQIMGVNGVDSPNVHVDNEHLRFMIDGIFSRCDLVAGVGKHRLVVAITNNQTFATHKEVASVASR